MHVYVVFFHTFYIRQMRCYVVANHSVPPPPTNQICIYNLNSQWYKSLTIQMAEQIANFQQALHA